MQFGVHLPHNGRLASRESLRRFAGAADALGYDSCWASDHIVWPDPAEIESRYPYSEDGSFAAPADSFVSAALEYWRQCDDLPSYDYNIEAARELLAGAGYSWDDDGRLQYPAN